MPERSSLNQRIQVGVEATPGQSVAANKQLQAIGIEPSPNADIDQFRPIGNKYRSIATLGREWVEAAITGRGSYTEIVYVLSSVINTGVITTPVGGITARTWTFISSNTADDIPKTYTVEHGSSVRADKFTYGIITEFTMGFSRSGVEIGGSMLGQRLTDNITLTGSPTSIALQPVLPTEVSVFLDTTSGALGTTKLTRLISAELSVGSRFGPVYVVDSASSGFVAHVETEPDLTLSITAQADSQAMALLTQMRDGSTRFIRIRAVGALIETTVSYELVIDLAVKIVDTGGFSDNDGVYGIEWNFVGVNDSGWGQALKIAVTNTLTSL